MKNISLCILFVISVQLAQAQNSVQGKVFDKDTKEALFAATVYIPDLKIGVITDTSGAFVLNNVPRGKFLLEVKLIGYSSQAITANSANTHPLQIFLSQSA